MTKHYVDKADPSQGSYEIFTGPKGARWHWTEMDGNLEPVRDVGPWEASAAQAYRSAADDWESNGNSSNPRLAGQLRAAATRAEKAAS